MWRAGKRGMYVDAVIDPYTEVQPERLEKRYHRAWHHVTGASHARLHYRDSITPDGALDESMTASGRPGLRRSAGLSVLRGVGGHTHADWLANTVAGPGTAIWRFSTSAGCATSGATSSDGGARGRWGARARWVARFSIDRSSTGHDQTNGFSEKGAGHRNRERQIAAGIRSVYNSRPCLPCPVRVVSS